MASRTEGHQAARAGQPPAAASRSGIESKGRRQRSRLSVSALRPAPLPLVVARAPSRQCPGPAAGTAREAKTPPRQALRPGAALTRSSGRGSLRPQPHHPRACLPRWFLPPQTPAPAQGQFENGADRRSQLARRRRRGCPGNGSSDRLAARSCGAPGGEGGAGASEPGSGRAPECADGASRWPANPCCGLGAFTSGRWVRMLTHPWLPVGLAFTGKVEACSPVNCSLNVTHISFATFPDSHPIQLLLLNPCPLKAQCRSLYSKPSLNFATLNKGHTMKPILS